MKLTVATICFNSPPNTMPFWGQLAASTTDRANTEFLVVNNGSTDGTADWLRKIVPYHWPKLRVLTNPENVGIPAAINQCIREADGDIVAVLHNDLWLLHPDWDGLVRYIFQTQSRCGLAGFFGALRAEPDGGRSWCLSNLMNAEDHGRRCPHPAQVCLFDGLALIFRKEAWADCGGIDEGIGWHHFYDKDASLSNLHRGWQNWLIPVCCYHGDGATSGAGDYERWAARKLGVPEGQGNSNVFAAARHRYLEKWHGRLPWEVRG